MFTFRDFVHDDREFFSPRDVIEHLRTLKPDVYVEVDAPAGRYTGLDTIPYYGNVADVTFDLRQRYGVK